MKMKVRGKDILILQAENEQDRKRLEAIREKFIPPKPFAWFRGGVNHELLKKFVELEKAGKLAT